MTVERLYGEDKKKALSIFYDNFCEEIDQLFFNKFQELSDFLTNRFDHFQTREIP